MNILITGGAGFIGSNFVRFLMNNYSDYNITVLDKLTYAGNLKNIEDLKNKPNFNFVKGDICNAKLANELIEKSEIVVNFAAETHVDRSIKDADSFIYSNFVGTYTLLEASRKHEVEKYVQISTDEVYGSVSEDFSKENDPLNPSNPYSASKGACDLLVNSYFITYNLPVVTTRSSNNYGPYQHPEKFISNSIVKASIGGKIPVYGDGLNIRDWLFVEDNCRGIDIVIQGGKIGEVYNIAGDNQYKNIDIAKKILEIMGKSQDLIEFVEDRPGHDRRYALDWSMILNLGWKPEIKLEEGLKRTVEWYLSNGWWWRPLIA